MKRLIQYSSPYESDGATFGISTKFVCLDLVDDSAGIDELREYARMHGLKIRSKLPKIDKGRGSMPKITHAVELISKDEVNTGLFFQKFERRTVYFGFVELDTSGPLIPHGDATRPKKITDEQDYEIFNGQHYGANDCGDDKDGNRVFIADHWVFNPTIKLLGYDVDDWYARFEWTGFSDDTYSCSKCGVLDSADDGYTCNHRVIQCELIGINCGCYEEVLQDPDVLDEYVNRHEECIEASAAEFHAKAGRIKKIQTYIGGMVDGRGGYIDGESVPEGQPEEIMDRMRADNPGKSYLFAREESGQFQTYFTLYEVK